MFPTKILLQLTTVLLLLLPHCYPCFAEYEFAVETYPVLTSDFELVNTQKADSLFFQGAFSNAAKLYGEIAKLPSWSKHQRSSILAKQSWALCLKKEYSNALKPIDEAIDLLPKSSHCRVYGLIPLKSRILIEAGKPEQALRITKENFLQTLDLATLQDYLVCLFLNGKGANFKTEYRKGLSLIPVKKTRFAPPMAETLICNCQPPSQPFMGGLFCTSTKSQLITQWQENLKSSKSPDMEFRETAWKSASSASDHRLRMLKHLIEKRQLLGVRKEKILSLLGAPTFSGINNDCFPICYQRVSRKRTIVTLKDTSQHMRVTHKLTSEPGIRDPRSNDRVWFLRLTYDEQGTVASADIFRSYVLFTLQGLPRF